MTPGERTVVGAVALGIVIAALVLMGRIRQRNLRPADVILASAIVAISAAIGALFLGPPALAAVVATLLMLASGAYLTVTDEPVVRSYRYGRLAGWLLLASAAVTALGWLVSAIIRP